MNYVQAKRLTHCVKPDAGKTICGKPIGKMLYTTREAWEQAKRSARFCFPCFAAERKAAR